MQYTRRCARKRGSLEYLYLEGVLQKGSSLEGILKVWVHLIYKSKHGVSVCVDKNWAVPGRFFQSLPVPCGAGDKQGRGRAGQGGQGSRCGGPREVPFLLKKSFGKTGGPASNQTKIHFFLKKNFIIEHIKKTRIFLKKKKEKK
jgi:hypothetical protein